MEIIDYNEHYALKLNKLDSNYWGYNKKDNISDKITSQDIMKLAIIDDKVIGMLDLKIIENLADLNQILIEEKYQKQGVGTKLMEKSIQELKKKNIETMIAHAVECNGNINSKKLLKNFGFKELSRVQNYWNSVYPNHYCKQCDSKNCYCGVVVYMKEMCR